jgi:DNA-binding NarL/FixJ family response regulator
MPVRILIADDQTLMRDGLKTILDLEDDMEVVGTASNGLEALEMTEKLKPDAVLMDIRMPVMDGVECTRLIKKKFPDIAVIMLTTFNDEEYIIQALTYGASGYLLKDMQGDKLIQAIREGVRGDLLMPATVAAKLASRLSNMKNSMVANERDASKVIALSERETEIARLIMEGAGNRQIADALSLTEGTVKNYISSIYLKLGTNDRAHAIELLRERFGMK